MEEYNYDLVELKNFITERFSNKKTLEKYLQKNMAKIISDIIDADEDFLKKEKSYYSNDEEINYIIQNTGYSFNFIEKVLWERYCFEMEEGIWLYNADVCLSCSNEELVSKEIPDLEFGEKVVCQKCGFEMVIGPEGLEEYN